MNRDRRRLLLALAGGAGVLGFGFWRQGSSVLPLAQAGAKPFEVTHSNEEWRKLLSSDAYAVLRLQATEPPYSSALNNEHRVGTFTCGGCNLELYASKTKFESGTGWPSFWQPLDGAVNEVEDRSHGMIRTEVQCRRCGGHLGHVFKDGPPPTGLRYCMNGAAMKFKPSAG